MLKRIAFGFTVVVITLMPLLDPHTAPSVIRGQHVYGFNDKMLILHHGREICVDWWAWPGHMIQHGDTLVGSGSCDVPSKLRIQDEL
jgi:hypothetical protein